MWNMDSHGLPSLHKEEGKWAFQHHYVQTFKRWPDDRAFLAQALRLALRGTSMEAYLLAEHGYWCKEVVRGWTNQDGGTDSREGNR